LKKSRLYKTAVAFRTALEDRLAKAAMAENVDLQRLRRQVAFDRLLARLGSTPNSPWILKGGYAMELRFEKARTTKDLDFTLQLNSKVAPVSIQVLDLVQTAAASDMGDFFIYRIGEATADLDGAPYGGSRYPAEAVLADKTFARFHLDVGVGDIVMEPAEIFHSRDWLGFAGIPPATILAISKEQQFAEKIHAYTLPRLQNPNSRVRDLVDLVLLVGSNQLSPEKTKEAIGSTFHRRSTHPIPPFLQSPPPTWDKPFIALASECGLNISIDEAFRIVISDCITYYNSDRTHDSLGKDSPAIRPISNRPNNSAAISSSPRVGGLHHRYDWHQAA
jgi:hypothetical protein